MRIIITIILSICCLAITAQDYTTQKTASSKALKCYQKGRELTRANQLDKALASFEKALKVDSKFIDAKIEWAGIKYGLGDVPAAEKVLEEVVGMDPYYKTKLLYTLAVIKKKKGDCTTAIEYYQQYIAAPKARDVLKEKSEKGIGDCELLSSAASSGENYDFEPQLMSASINTKDREYFPSLSADGETFFFARNIRGQEDIYFCKKTDTGWSAAEPLSDVNTNGNEANQSFSADGRLIVFTACDRKGSYGSCDLYLSEYKNGQWIAARNMGKGINTSAWDAQPSLSADGNLLFFTSNRSGGKGKADIYYSKRNAEGAWSVAKSLKGQVNTKGEEHTPYLHQDGETLYFKSTGHSGFGGFDIFYAKKQADGTWGKPENMGKPINSELNEGSFMVSLDGETAYFDSDILYEGKDAGKMNPDLHDIYEVKLPKKFRPNPVTYVKAKVLDANTKKPIEAAVDFVNLKTQRQHARNITDEKGAFLVCLPVGNDYGLNVSKEGYLFHSENFSLPEGSSTDTPFEITIMLNRIPEEVAATPAPQPSQPVATPTPPAPIILKNVFFASGSAVLEASSTAELMRLYDLLIANPKMNIQINGHTDNVGSDTDNIQLSSDRAKAVYNFLVQKGITNSRLKYKGYGENQPIDSNDTPEGRQNNRRTEFLVL